MNKQKTTLKYYSITGAKIKTEDWNKFRIIISAAIFGFFTALTFIMFGYIYYFGLEKTLIALIVSVSAGVWLFIEWNIRKGDSDINNYKLRRKNFRFRQGIFRAFFWLLVPVNIFSLKSFLETKNLTVGLLFAVGAVAQISSWLFLFKERRREKYPWTDPKIGKVTKFGFFHSLLTVGVGVIAIQTGLNLVYSIFGVLLALIIVSMILSRINFFRLKIERDIPEELFAQTPVLAEANITNNKNWFSVFSIWMEEAWPPDILRPSVMPFAYALRIKAKSTEKLNYEITFPKRGIFTFLGFTFATRFPFSMFTYFYYTRKEQKVVVYPNIRDLPRELKLFGNHIGENVPNLKQQSSRDTGDFRTLREYNPGFDDIRRIHWKTSARTSKLMVQEYDAFKETTFVIVLELSKEGEIFEKAIEYAAALINNAFQRRLGFALIVPTAIKLVNIKPTKDDRNRAFAELAQLKALKDEKDIENYYQKLREFNLIELEMFTSAKRLLVLTVDDTKEFGNWCNHYSSNFRSKLTYKVK